MIDKKGSDHYGICRFTRIYALRPRYLAIRAEFFRLQNWENMIAHIIMLTKKMGRTSNRKDL